MQATAAGKRGTVPYRATQRGAHQQKLTSTSATGEARRDAGASTTTPPMTNQVRRPDAQTTEEGPKKESLFEGLSVAQLSAGALAAVTSMLLASRIGIAGSVIGVAIASVVSAVATHVYRRVFEASAEKIRTIGTSDDAMRAPVVNDGQMAVAANASTVTMRATTRNNTLIDGVGKKGLASVEIPADAAGTVTADQTRAALARYSRKHVTASGVRAVGCTVPREDMSAVGSVSSQRKTRAAAIAVSVVAALVAVAISALVIDVVTAGQGVGAKPAAITWTASDEVGADSATAEASADKSSNDYGKDSASSSAATDTFPGTSDSADAAASESADAGSGSNADAATGDASSPETDASGVSVDSASGQSTSTGSSSTSGESASSNGAATNSSTSEDQPNAQGQSADNDSSSSSASTDAKMQQSAA